MPKALTMAAIGGSLQLIDRPAPAPEAGEVAVRVRAAGICHSDEHFRAGHAPHMKLPRVLGHEAAGEVIAVGGGVSPSRVGERVCVHYVVSCGHCDCCTQGLEQFCSSGQMIGLHRDGGFAEYLAIPAANAITLPDAVSFADGAVLMCAGATAMHGIKRSRFRAGESVAVFGVGGIGMFAIQIAQALGASEVFAVDLDPAKLDAAAAAGARAVDARGGDAPRVIRQLAARGGVDVALECIGLPVTIVGALESLGIHGRAVIVGLAGRPAEVDTYKHLLARETELMGCNDHLRVELPELLALAASGKVRVDASQLRRVPFTADSVNGALDDLRAYRAPVRTVIDFAAAG